MLAQANIVALRGWEFSCIAMWAVGLWLVFRLARGAGGAPPTSAAGAATGSSRLYLGLYSGASYLWWGAPWTSIVFIVAAQVPIIFLARRLADLVQRVPEPAPVTVGAGPGSAPATAPAAGRLGWLPFWAALPIAPAGIYA